MRIASSIVVLALTLFIFGQVASPQQSGQSPPAAATHPAPPHSDGGAADQDETGATSDSASETSREPLAQISGKGGIPTLYSTSYGILAEQIRHRASVRNYPTQIRQIRQKHFGTLKSETLRAEGIALLAEFTDPAAFIPLFQELAKEKDDVRLAMLDHFKAHGDEGQGALAHVVIYDKDTAIRNEALRRMKGPAPQPVLYEVDHALRNRDADVVNAAAVIVNALDMVRAIPALIFAQVNVTGPAEPAGDLAWIAIQTQRAYVAGLVPVVGNNAGGFQPIIGVVSEGAILRVVDAVVIEYRTVAHASLVNFTTRDWGKPTDSLGFNLQSWWEWYNNEYVPFKNGQAKS